MKVTNNMQNSLVVAGKEIKAGQTEVISDKKWEEASEGRVIKALLEKRCLVIEESKAKKKKKEPVEELTEDEVTEELKSFADELKAFHGL